MNKQFSFYGSYTFCFLWKKHTYIHGIRMWKNSAIPVTSPCTLTQSVTFQTIKLRLSNCSCCLEIRQCLLLKTYVFFKIRKPKPWLPQIILFLVWKCAIYLNVKMSFCFDLCTWLRLVHFDKFSMNLWRGIKYL